MLKNKTILLSGACGSVGSAIASLLAKRGARLILLESSSELSITLTQELTKLKAEYFVLLADIATHLGRETIRTALLALKQPLDAIVNCADANLFAFLADSDVKNIEELMSINVMQPILLTKISLPFLNPKSGRIVNIGSTCGSVGFPGGSAYCASKFALHGFTEALRRELSDSDLQVGYLAVRTMQTYVAPATNGSTSNELHSAMQKSNLVAIRLEKMLTEKHLGNYIVGWKERVLSRMNSLFPWIIDIKLRERLPIIRRNLEYIMPKTICR